MDPQVQQALIKWPNVPHCFGWLALDARGNWRMRDNQAQTLNLLGDKIHNPTLRAFINRNYLADEIGRYYFQNGPQRVYVNFQATPYIAQFFPDLGWMLHTGQKMPLCNQVWMTEDGAIILKSGNYVAQIDDRDMTQALAQIKINGRVATTEELMDFLENKKPSELYQMAFENVILPLKKATLQQLAAQIPFVVEPKD